MTDKLIERIANKIDDLSVISLFIPGQYNGWYALSRIDADGELGTKPKIGQQQTLIPTCCIQDFIDSDGMIKKGARGTFRISEDWHPDKGERVVLFKATYMGLDRKRNIKLADIQPARSPKQTGPKKGEFKVTYEWHGIMCKYWESGYKFVKGKTAQEAIDNLKSRNKNSVILYRNYNVESEKISKR